MTCVLFFMKNKSELLTPRSIRREFDKAIAKYSSPDTKEQGFKAAIALMDEYYTCPQLFLSAMQDSQKVSMEYELLTIGYVCQLIFKNFEHDRTPEKDKLITRILNLTLVYFKDNKQPT